MIRRALAVTVLAAALSALTGCGVSGHSKVASLGPVRWRWRPPPPASVGMPVADRDGVFAEFSHTFLVSVAPDGSERWRSRRLGMREETPLLTTDLVVVPADDGLVAFERSTGHVRWDTLLGHSTAVLPDIDDRASTPVLAGSIGFTCLSGGALVAVDVGSGAVRWRAPLAGRCDGPPATDGHTVVATWDPERGAGAGIAAFDAASGERRWTAPLRAGGVSAPAVVGTSEHPLAVAVDDDLAAKAFDLHTGKHLWTTPVGGAGSPEVPPLAQADGRVLVADRLAGLTLLDSDGRRQWRARADAAAERGAPVGPVTGGVYALPLDNGKVLLAGPSQGRAVVRAPGGLVSGVAASQPGALFVSSAQGRDNQLVAYGP
jgi:outer membrane protein assembly factor BamB